MKKKIFKWLNDNFELVFMALFIGLAIASFNAASPIFLCLAFHHVRHYQSMREIDRKKMLVNTLFDSSMTHIHCVEELSNKLAPHIGHEAVVAILQKYGVEWEKAWKPYNDKYPPSKPKKKKEQKVYAGEIKPVGSPI